MKKKNNIIPVNHYKVYFKTLDDYIHEYSGLKYIDESEILYSALEFYLLSEKFLKDDDGVMYPISSVLSVWAVKDDTGRVIKEGRFWYERRKLIYEHDEV